MALHRSERKKHIRIYVLVGLIAVNVLLWHVYFSTEPDGILTVAFLSVGQNDAIYIESPDHHRIVIDAGPTSDILGKLGGIMHFYEHSLDAIVLSNTATGSVTGFLSVLYSYAVEQGFQVQATSSGQIYDGIEKILVQKKIPVLPLKREDRIVLAPDVFLSVLFPDRDLSYLKSGNTINSLVFRLMYKNTSMLFVGSAPASVEKYLVELDRTNLKSDLLSIGHLPSKQIIPQIFLDTVRPKYVITPTAVNGKENSPDGAVIFRSDGMKWSPSD